MIENLKDMRNARNLSQEALAKKLGVDRTTVTKLENGTQDASLSQLKKIAKILGCTVQDLIAETEGGWAEPPDENLIWQIMASVVEQARAQKDLDRKLLIAIAQTLYRGIRNGKVSLPKGKDKAKSLAKHLDAELSRFVEFEALRTNSVN